MPYPDSQDERKSLLASQVDHPVRWQETIENMAAQGVQAFLEVGPGTTLSGLIQKTLPEAAVYHIADAASLEKAAAALSGGALC